MVIAEYVLGAFMNHSIKKTQINGSPMKRGRAGGCSMKNYLF